MMVARTRVCRIWGNIYHLYRSFGPVDEPEIEEGSLVTIFHGFAAKLATTAQAVGAVTRLISGAADVPTAWLESQARRIRVDEEARSLVIRAVAESAANEAT